MPKKQSRNKICISTKLIFLTYIYCYVSSEFHTKKLLTFVHSFLTLVCMHASASATSLLYSHSTANGYPSFFRSAGVSRGGCGC